MRDSALQHPLHGLCEWRLHNRDRLPRFSQASELGQPAGKEHVVGRVDDGDAHVTNASMRAFNDTLADLGYTVQVKTGQGYFYNFTSARVKRNYDIIVANRRDGNPLPEPYWPLKLVGKGLSSNEMLGNVVEIQIIFPGR